MYFMRTVGLLSNSQILTDETQETKINDTSFVQADWHIPNMLVVT